MFLKKTYIPTYFLILGILLFIAFQMISPRFASAYYIEIEAAKIVVPSFDVVGTVPLTQIGTGNADSKGTAKGSGVLHKALASVVPLGWNYFLSTGIPFCSHVIWDATKDISWVHTLEKMAISSKIRILVDWNYKSILVLAESEKGNKSVFFNPRQGIKGADVINLSLDSPIKDLNFTINGALVKDCNKEKSPSYPGQSK